ncbi:MAG: hypothetical protein KJO24_00615 [Gammaproteobacteria bacterium]|nr:hypothetical protein [Gammaproteobacteria bacterium]
MAAKASKKIAVRRTTKAGKQAGKKVARRFEKVDYSKKVGVDLSYIGSKDEVAETRNVASRERVRTELESEVEKFLKTGGTISNIKPNVMADPPKKPESNYGSRPI